jgi:hypothetical protein
MLADPPKRVRPRLDPDPPAPPPVTVASRREEMAAARRQRGRKWRTYKVPPHRPPGGRRPSRKEYNPRNPRPKSRRRRQTPEQIRRTAQRFVQLFKWLGLLLLVAVLRIAGASDPATSDRGRWTSDGFLTTKQTEHPEGKNGDSSPRTTGLLAQPQTRQRGNLVPTLPVGMPSWTLLRPRASVHERAFHRVRGARGLTPGLGPRGWTAFTPRFPQNEPKSTRLAPSFGVTFVGLASISGRSRGPPRIVSPLKIVPEMTSVSRDDTGCATNVPSANPASTWSTTHAGHDDHVVSPATSAFIGADTDGPSDGEAW